MTELEQKAEEYLKELGKKKIPFSITNAHNCIKQAYKDGYEQGQQTKSLEVICKDCSIKKQVGKQCDDLLKENAELKKEIDFNIVSVSNGGYCCVCQRCKRTFIGDKRQLFCKYCEQIGKLEKENAELKAENEKLHCCGNCKTYDETVCTPENLLDNICDKWKQRG